MKLKRKGETSWVETLIEAYNTLGGEAHLSEVYPIAKKVHLRKGMDCKDSYEAIIRDCIQRHSSDSNSKKRSSNAPDVFYSVAGGNRGLWGLRNNYVRNNSEPLLISDEILYLWGLEGIVREAAYLRRIRDQQIVQERKRIDDFTCQVCGYRRELPNGLFVVDVHHLNPLGGSSDLRITSTEDLICLCPNCHRIAHSRPDRPLEIVEVREIVASANF